MPRLIDLTGQAFGRLTVVSLLPTRGKGGKTLWRCRCSCGNWNPSVSGSNLKSGHTASCGCLMPEVAAETCSKRVIHGCADKTSNYKRWQSMKQRTGNPNDKSYEDYGGRGISVYEEWLESFPAFNSWLDDNLGPRPDGYSLDRINNDGNYEPGNLRWASVKTQNNNRRSCNVST